MATKLFTHNDLDGAGCAVIIKFLLNRDADVAYCSYDNINERVMDFIISRDYMNYDEVFITDISINQEVAELIEETSDLANMLSLVDHHGTALFLNGYEWAYVRESEPEKNLYVSGTSLLYDELECEITESLPGALSIFVEKVTNWDTWLWDKIGDENAKDLNTLFGIKGHFDFVNDIVDNLDNDIYIKDNDLILIGYEKKKIERYINDSKFLVFPMKLLNYDTGVVFVEQYVSEVGNTLSKLYPEYDFITVINLKTKKISYRTIKEDIDLGKDVAKYFGGGGHPKSAGSSIDNQALQRVFRVIT